MIHLVSASSALFGKEHLARHHELNERYDVRLEASPVRRLQLNL
jgi:hypothetical protein